MNPNSFELVIEKASNYVGNTWPLYSFVTSNPLSGYEKVSFPTAVKEVQKMLGASVYPKGTLYRNALDNGDIEISELKDLLQKSGYKKSPGHYLQLMERQQSSDIKNPHHVLDRRMVKWLSAFLDEGLAEWEMPFKELGFYNAWRKLASYDEHLGSINMSEIPKTPIETLESLLARFSDEEIHDIVKFHLAALPGWTGYIKHRGANQSLWQKKYPIDLEQYLAVRLWSAKQLGMELLPETKATETDHEMMELQHIWLKAWEKSWQMELVRMLKDAPKEEESYGTEPDMPDAQLVFCIDTRSELIRRHVESAGNYETFGYAGFFGIAMDYENTKDDVVQKSCPPIVDSSYKVFEVATDENQTKKKSMDQKVENTKFWNYFLKRMKNMLPSTFGFVEGSGLYYGLNLVARTIAPAGRKRKKPGYENICEPELRNAHSNASISIADQAAIVKSGFELMGWKSFAPVVIFVGHGSHSANNPFASSLDCGACAASPGRHNARMLAKMTNNLQVREFLSSEHGIDIPSSTIFVGAEHNTTTDEIELFDSQVPESHQNHMVNIKKNLVKARASATQDRLGAIKNSVGLARINATNWGETRPEWGLAKNASFVIGPRKTTMHHNLDGRCFLHSYDWKMDKEGRALEAIMQGPMVVTQWINNHYYFATVDNEKFGAGTKTTHNITGQYGVVQGNGGDLKMGLPWESLYESEDKAHHTPFRLTVVIQAPKERVNAIVDRNKNIKSLLENEWIYLIIMDPQDNIDVLWNKNQILQTRMDEEADSLKEKIKIQSVEALNIA
ncbi:DUF2309 domain-containing protein [Muricauda ruestringensis]|uniref:Probable inorganic carbon transporter subunit DabA n=1 Tax=Flagellimonas aurea TaxID=2915619 RepID=A0ABS3G343_9FLAO|nr:DUF2309 domain-containing protein [Allomuricauda aurea]MBO0353378.1 DUF2309 domain-containing protein [Allomuricauda aurea]